MFNQLTPSDIVGAIGVAARDAARSTGGASDFQRDQLLSAYSATRHLTAELRDYAPVWRAFTAQAAATLREGAEQVHARGDVLGAADRLEDADAGTAGDTLCEVLAALRDDPAPAAGALRTRIQGQLRELSDREVDLQAEALSS